MIASRYVRDTGSGCGVRRDGTLRTEREPSLRWWCSDISSDGGLSMAKSTRSRRAAADAAPLGSPGAAAAASPARPRPICRRDARRRLAMLDWHEPTAQREPDRPPLRGQPPDRVPLAGRFDRLPARDPRGPRLGSAASPPSDLDDRAAAGRPGDARAYPRWGKDKLRVLLRREGIVLSVSMVGRILARLRGRRAARAGVAAG